MDTSSKYVQTAELLLRRIAHGDYCNGSLPGAPKLAQELGLSYMTIRQAMQHLIDGNHVIRGENGRLLIPNTAVEHQNFKAAFIHPASTGNSKWHRALEKGAHRFGCSFQDITFQYCDDQVVFDAFDGNFNLLFFQLPIIPPILFQKILRNRERVVSLFTDLTEYGIRRFDGFSNDAVEKLLLHLQQRGCRKIDFLNTEPSRDGGGHRRLAWEKTLKKFHCPGEIYNDNVVPPGSSGEHARTVMNRLLRDGCFRQTDALFCNSVSVARGAIRALADNKLRVPEDMAVVSFGNPEEAQMNTPSITVVNTPDLNPLAERVFKHYLGIEPSPTRLHYQVELGDVPEESILLHGESVAESYLSKYTPIKEKRK